jgi:hypothetical protein
MSYYSCLPVCSQLSQTSSARIPILGLEIKGYSQQTISIKGTLSMKWMNTVTTTKSGKNHTNA